MKANERANHSPGDTYRSTKGRARMTFWPDWCESQPWVAYIDGTAWRHFATLNAGIQELARQGHTIVLPTVEEQNR